MIQILAAAIIGTGGQFEMGGGVRFLDKKTWQENSQHGFGELRLSVAVAPVVSLVGGAGYAQASKKTADVKATAKTLDAFGGVRLTGRAEGDIYGYVQGGLAWFQSEVIVEGPTTADDTFSATGFCGAVGGGVPVGGGAGLGVEAFATSAQRNDYRYTGNGIAAFIVISW